MVIRKSGLSAAIAGIATLALAACGGSSSSSGTSSAPATAGGGASSASGAALPGGDKSGGTLYYLTGGDKFLHLDPQRNYTGVDLNFAGAFFNRTLTTYAIAPGKPGTEIVPDMATDIGKPDATGKTWVFTLRDGVSFEDGSPVTCADIKYGVSRTFATDVITDGPQYATQFLDVAGKYPGPYKATPAEQAAFDKSIDCSADGKTITFHLKLAVPDFNGATTLTAFSPVQKAKDTAEKFDMTPISTGPYKAESYVEKKSLVLVRNDKWDPASDPVRKAYPDKIVVQFSLNPQVIDQRLKQSSGDDASAIGDPIDAADLDAIFKDTSLADRVSNQGTPFTRYIAINAKKVPNVKQRQALMAALDREAYRKLSGGDYAGDYADGAINANLGQDYAPTGLWDTVLGAAVPATGDIALAKKLIADSGEPPVAITYDYGKAKNDNTADKAAAIIKTSWEKAGFKVTLNPIERSKYYGVVLDEAKQGSASVSGWGPDWLNASTVIPPLFKPDGGFDLSHYGDAGFQAKIVAASATLDRGAQAKAWQELNTEVVKAGLIIPTWFDKEQLIFGTKVKTVAGGGKPYSNSAFAGAPFADLYVTK